MTPLGLSQNKLVRDLDVPVARVNDIIHARRGISADTALRFAAYFATTAEFWLNLQSRYDLKVAERKAGAEITRRVRRWNGQLYSWNAGCRAAGLRLRGRQL
jgi:antitoxin HigA-1